MKDFFDFVKSLYVHGLPASIYGPALLRFRAISPLDLASLQKSLGHGGSSGNTTHFCIYCMINNEMKGLAKEGTERCTRCLQRNIGSCYCRQVEDTDQLKVHQANLEQLLAGNIAVHCENYDRIAHQSKLVFSEQTVNKEGDPNHLCFDVRGKHPAEKKNI